MKTKQAKKTRRSDSNATQEHPFSWGKGTEPCDYYEEAKLGGLVPGIIHNLSTPLSGVLGGIQLLEMRALNIAEALEKLGDIPETPRQELQDHLERNQKSVELISRNAQNLSNLVQNLSTRMARFSIKTPDIYGLNQLVEMETRYLEFNLTFKHRVKRQLNLGTDLPPLRCVFSRFARGLEALIYTAIEQKGSQKNACLDMTIHTRIKHDQLVLSLDFDVDTSWFDKKLSAPADCHGATLQHYFNQLQEDDWDVEMHSSEMGTEFLLTHAPMRLASHR